MRLYSIFYQYSGHSSARDGHIATSVAGAGRGDRWWWSTGPEVTNKIMLWHHAHTKPDFVMKRT